MSLRAAATTTVAALAAALAAALPVVVAGQAAATPVPQPPAATEGNRAAAREAAGSPGTLDTLSRFFAREGRISAAAARPRIEGETIPVHYLSPDFVAGRADAPVSRMEFLVSKAVSSDGQQAALWTAKTGAGWQVVNIATGDDEFRYGAVGARKLPGGTVFREPQIDAWYVSGGGRVLPLDEDAVRAVGDRGTTLAAYRARVVKAYGDKLPGSAYARGGKAGGYDAAAVAPGAPGAAGAGAGAPAEAVAAAAAAAGPAPGPESGLLPVIGAASAGAAVLALLGVRRVRRAQTTA
ncbi:hypothetical protein [Streptomyces sp. NPDC048603]|uniref:hypothetical protein n=1 Tax=Streptomyces sp. NPDC048603 TaxID=3365577 RepID=UPI003720A321